MTRMAALALLLAGITLEPAYALKLYVSPAGNDAWSGTLAEPNADRTDGPFASPRAARDAVRARRQAAGAVREDVGVSLRGGDYILDEPLEFTTDDGGGKDRGLVAWYAAKGEHPRLMAGREVRGFQPVDDPAMRERLAPEARGHVLAADLKACGVTNFGDAVRSGQRLELFFDDEPMTLARWPNEGYVTVEAITDEEAQKIHGVTGSKVGKFIYSGDRPQRWQAEKEVWLYGFWFWDWANGYQKIASIDTDARRIELEKPYHNYGYRPGQRYFALNLLGELDQPGEWYLDRDSGMLYFWPPGPIDSARAYVSVLGNIMTFKDVSGFSLEGIEFNFSRDVAVTVNGGWRIFIMGCTFRNLGTQAITMTGGTVHGVSSCDIFNTGSGGITVDAGDRTTLTPGKVGITNNHIHHFSRLAKTYGIGIFARGVGNRVANNLLHDAPHGAIWLSGNEHIVEFNEVHHVCMETDDAGAFYMGRDWTARGNQIRHNYFHDIGDFHSRIGVQSIYLDDWTSGTTLYGNICDRGGRGVLLGGGRNNTVENNIFVDCSPAVHVDSRGLGWARNYFNGQTTTLVDRLKAMPYREPPWSTKYPELLTLYEDEPALAKYNAVVRNICVGGKWLDFLDGLTDKVVRVEDNLVGQDPGFENPGKADFRLKPDSPAWKLGFKPIPLERIGVQPNPLRPTAASRPW